ncbi:MAG: hypothetical protein GY703_00705, partial [Gammaproteobacteria bacterium]|nr:hypothetical protein [Gammaproteobacteria bacterium]
MPVQQILAAAAGVSEIVLPDSRETEAVLPDSGETVAMLPVAGHTLAVLPDSGEPKAMSLGDGETEAVLPDSGETKAMSFGDGETEATTAPPQLSNGERRRLPPPTLMFQQETWDPPDELVLARKPTPQLVTAPPHLSNVERRRLTPTTLLFKQEEWDPPDVLVQLSAAQDSRFFGLNLPLLRPPPEPAYANGRFLDTYSDVPGEVYFTHFSIPWTRGASAAPKTSSPMSAPLMPYGRFFRQHLHRHRRRDKLIAGMHKTSSPTAGSSMPYGRFLSTTLPTSPTSPALSLPPFLANLGRASQTSPKLPPLSLANLGQAS